MFSMFGYEGGEVATPMPLDFGAVGVAIDARELKGDFSVFDKFELDREQAAMVEELGALREDMAQGSKTNELILDQLKHMQERIDVLEANTFVEAFKWIFEKICELACKMQKVMVDIGENMPLIGANASRAREFSDLDKLYEKELSRIEKLDGKNELGDNAQEIAALKANAKVGYEARQSDLHKDHEKQVDAKYGKGMYTAQQGAKAAGIEVTPEQKAAIWKADTSCKYNQIDQKQQAHVEQREKHGALLAKKWPELQKAGQFVGRKAGEAGQAIGEKASAAKQAMGSFAERVSKGSAPAAGAQR